MVRGDCFERMAELPESSVDCILTDLPYGGTDNAWDKALPMEKLWAAWKRIAKPGAAIVLFTQQPFTTRVAASNLKELRTEWIWVKHQGTGFLNANRYPLKSHENVLVFCGKTPRYFPRKLESGRGPYSTTRKPNTSMNYRSHGGCTTKCENGLRMPTTVLTYGRKRPEDFGHPTQKPLALVEYLIETYTNPGETVLDCCAGSGTTVVAALRTDRIGIGIELDEAYFRMATERLRRHETCSLKQAS